MTHSALTNQIRLSNQSDSRRGTTVDTFLIHHQAGTNDDATISAMVSGSKEVSANYTISNEGRLTCVVDEDRRAWTSGSSSDGGRGAAWDRRSITVEIENQSAGGNWPISDAALNTAAALLRDLRGRYNIVNVLGHRDLYSRYGASYATFCPGPNTVASILALAGGGAALPSAPSAPASSTLASSAPSGAGVHEYTSTEEDGIRGPIFIGRVQTLGTERGIYDGVIDRETGPLTEVARIKITAQALNGWVYGPHTTTDEDGIPGRNYWMAVQSVGKAQFGYDGLVDGDPGPKTYKAENKITAHELNAHR